MTDEVKRLCERGLVERLVVAHVQAHGMPSAEKWDDDRARVDIVRRAQALARVVLRVLDEKEAA